MQKKYAEVKQNNKKFTLHEEKDKSLSQLQSKISLSNFQMLEMTLNDQKFAERIQDFNEKALLFIQQSKFQEALVYLGEAQKLLQYAAGRGCSLDRQVIVKILNNQAVGYQKIWDMERSISYLEAIIFHIDTFIELKQNKDLVNQIKIKSHQAENSSFQKEELKIFLQTNYDKIKNLIQKKFSLSLYFLQFSILNSQNQFRKIAIDYSKKALQSYENAFQISMEFMKLRKSIYPQSSRSLLLQSLLNQIDKFRCLKSSEESFMNIFKDVQKIFEQKSNISTSFHFILQKYASLQKKEAEYKNFSLNNVIELHPESFRREYIYPLKISNDEFCIKEIDDQNMTVLKVLQYAVTLFTTSSQMRESIESQVSDSMISKSEIFQVQQQKLFQAQKYHLLSLKISIEIVIQLSQFARLNLKNYDELYNINTKTNLESLTKMDSLKEKYKKFIKKGNSSNKDIDSSAQIFDQTISEYSINLRPTIKGKQKQNKLQKLFKQNSNTTPQKNNHGPPRLNIDLSEIQSVQYGASKTVKQKDTFSNKIKPSPNQDSKDTKESKNLNILQIKKILTVPNISDLSSNKQSQISFRNKSKSSKKDFKQKSKLKNKQKQKKTNNKIKSESSVSKGKFELRKFLSPKNFIQKFNQSPKKKKSSQNDLQMLSSQRKIFTQTQKDSNRKKQKNPIKSDEKLRKIQQTQITPQLSNRKISLKSQIEKVQLKPQTFKKSFKLRKAKSFQDVITPFEDIKPIIFQSKDISQGYNFRQANKESKVKLIADSKKMKSSQNIKLQTLKKQKLKKIQQNSRNQISLPCKSGQKKNQKMKDCGLKNKKNASKKIKQPHPSMAWKQNAVRMSSLGNLMQPISQKQAIKRLKSSQSIHNLYSSSDYMIKGLNVNSSQRTKAGSLAITESYRYK